jgi:NitT/TauT family transport system substrate-binding protein
MIRHRIQLAGALALGATASHAQTDVIFGTNWVAQAEHGGYYQSVADGTYAACGLNVTIQPGGPQINNEAQLIAGRIQFYMGGTLSAMDAVKEDIPLVIVAADFQKEPQIIMTHPGAAASFADVAKLDQFIIGDGGFVTYFKWMESAFGFDPAKRVPYTFNPAPFIANEMSAQQGYVTSEPFAVKNEAGWDPDVWLIADQGYSAYSTTIVTMQETIDTMPDAVKCFVEGSSKGWANFLYGDNAAAIVAIKAANPDMTDDQIQFSIEALKQYGIVDSGDTETMGIGAMTDARMEDFYTKMVTAGVLPEGLDYKKAYNTSFTNSGVSLPISQALKGQ